MIASGVRRVLLPLLASSAVILAACGGGTVEEIARCIDAAGGEIERYKAPIPTADIEQLDAMTQMDRLAIHPIDGNDQDGKRVKVAPFPVIHIVIESQTWSPSAGHYDTFISPPVIRDAPR